MNLKEAINYWVKSAQEDLKTAESLFKSKRWVHCLFFCHLFIEKVLKALVVKNTKNSPLPIHNLKRLAKDSGIALSEKQSSLLKEIRRKILNYLSLLEKEGIKIEKAIVFGSHAKGKPKAWSDIDVCLISEQFGKDIFEEGVALSHLADQIDLLIESHPYHPSDFQEKYDPLATEIKKHGIMVI